MISRRLRGIAVALALIAGPIAAAPALAVQPDEVLSDPALEARARALSAGLRCMVCQNQSIDDSDAPLAKDLRVLVRQRLTAGDSDAGVLDYLVSRYGQFVLLRPRFEWQTLALWATPVTLLALGAGFAVMTTRRRRRPDVAALSGEEEQALERVLGSGR